MTIVLLIIVCLMLAAIILAIHIAYVADKEIDTSLLEAKKYSYMFKVMNQWMQALHAGKSMQSYLVHMGYNRIAIYGMYYVGERLFEELDGTEVMVAYAVDKNKEVSNCDIKIYKPIEELPPVDLIVVTTALYFFEIKKQLREKLECPIISIEELVERMY